LCELADGRNIFYSSVALHRRAGPRHAAPPLDSTFRRTTLLPFGPRLPASARIVPFIFST